MGSVCSENVLSSTIAMPDPRSETNGPEQAGGAPLECQNLFLIAFRLSPVGMAIIRTADRTIMAANEAISHLWGSTPDEVAGQPVEKYSNWLSEEHRLGFQQTRAETGECMNYEMSLQMRDGRMELFKISSCMITFNNESCILSVMREITEERRTTLALSASELRYRRLFETAQDGILILDAATGMVVDVNPFLIKLLGFSHEQFLGKAIWELGFFKDVVANEEKFAELREKGYVRYEDLPLETRYGSKIEAEFVSNVYLVGGERVIQCNIRDVTDRRRAEEGVRKLNASLEERVRRRTAELELANKELEAFSYSVSHDLRAPLRAIDGYSQAVLEEYGPQLAGEGERYLQTIRAGAQQMGALIDDLLTFSRMSREPVKMQPINMANLVRVAIQELDSQEPSRVDIIQISDLQDCRGAPALLKQVWVNLLSNALKFTRKRESKIIEVGSQPGSDGPVYFVRDNGTGFDMRYAHKLFGVFQRLHRAEDYEGTGVGLAICQRIIHRHGGRIWAEAAVNQGATFFFTLSKETSS